MIFKCQQERLEIGLGITLILFTPKLAQQPRLLNIFIYVQLGPIENNIKQLKVEAQFLYAEWKKLMDINLKALFLTARI